MSNARSYRFGLNAERMAIWFLRFKGYRILSWRYKSPVGEVDIIARRRKTLVFVEVKARKTLDDALESVTPRMKQRIGRAAQSFISRHPELSQMDMRFDLIVIARPFLLRHLDNAWRPAA